LNSGHSSGKLALDADGLIVSTNALPWMPCVLQIAMMGGNVEHMLDGSSDPVSSGKAARGPSTKPMPVKDFLDKGLGGAQLPRKQQDRKDKEKLKRAAGQSTHSQWKSEAEMVLRQQFD
jgi:hypothetical protein